jgi:hypothetical protein
VAEDIKSLLQLGDAAARRGEIVEAVAFYEEAAKEYVGLSQHALAVAIWRQIVGMAPDRRDIRCQLAEGLVQQGWHEDARAALRQVVEEAAAAGDWELHDRAAERLATLPG